MDTGRRSVSLRLSLCRHRSPHLYKLKATGAASRPLPSAPAFSTTSVRALSGSMAYVTASIGDVARCGRVQCQNLAKAQRHYHSWLSSAAVL